MKKKSINVYNSKFLILSLLLIVFIGISFAYVVMQVSGGARNDINISADKTDQYQLNVDKDIYLNPTQFNLTQSDGNLVDSAIGTASLIANTTYNTASYNYNVKFSISSNTFIYTTETQKPEVILTIIGPDEEEVTNVSGLNYVTIVDSRNATITGFDITTASGIYNIATQNITSNDTENAKIQTWNFKVTFVNLDTNQSENGGKGLSAQIIME